MEKAKHPNCNAIQKIKMANYGTGDGYFFVCKECKENFGIKMINQSTTTKDKSIHFSTVCEYEEMKYCTKTGNFSNLVRGLTLTEASEYDETKSYLKCTGCKTIQDNVTFTVQEDGELTRGRCKQTVGCAVHVENICVECADTHSFNLDREICYFKK